MVVLLRAWNAKQSEQMVSIRAMLAMARNGFIRHMAENVMIVLLANEKLER